MTDTFRALCAELANHLQGRKELECGWGEEDPEQDLLDRARAALAQPEPVRFKGNATVVYEDADDSRIRTAKCIAFELHNGGSVLAAAKAIFRDVELGYITLPQPEPVPAAGLPPRIGHVFRLAEIIREVDGNHDKGAAALAEAILSHAGSMWRPAIEPVPVSERPILKSSNFNDANGHCWCGTSASVDETGDLSVEMPPSWELREPCAQDNCVLPHHALPVPAPSREENLDG